MFDYLKSKAKLHKEKKMLIEENLKLQEHIKASRKYEKFLADELFSTSITTTPFVSLVFCK